MRDASQRSTRRGFLATLALAAASSAGCSGFGASPGQSDPAGGSGSSAETAAATRTPAETGHENGEHSHDHGHDEDHTREDHADAAGPLGSFESLLDERFVGVESLRVEDSRIRLTYVTRSTRSHEIAAGIETVVVSFVQAYADDWRVDGLDAKLIEPSGTVMGYWRTETRWARPVAAGQETRTALLERTLDTYHGRLTRDHTHGDADSDGSEDTHDQGDGTGEHSHTDDGHSHDNGDGHSHDDGADDHAHEATATGHSDE